MRMLRIFYTLRVDETIRVYAGLSERYETPLGYARWIREQEGTPIAWEDDEYSPSAVGSKADVWFPRCREAIERGNHFFATKGEALAAWAAVKLES